MSHINARGREKAHSPKSRARRPLLEGLEDRLLLYSTTGTNWTYGSRITYSFMPDGTNIGGVPSSLFSTMNAYSSTASWEGAIEKAAAIWQQVANLNLALVSDNGEAEGAAGNQQDDPNVGDIRIGAFPQASGTLAETLLPPPANGGTNAGDLFFNSNQVFGTNGVDLLTVAIHEFGHALGLAHSAIQSADLYAAYGGIKQTLTSDDTAGIQSIYGAYPARAGNNSGFATAISLNANINGPGAWVSLSNLYIANSGDYEFYSVTVPSNTNGTLTVTMQSTNLSSLAPRLTLYNSSDQGLGQALSTNYGATVSFTISNVTAGQVYYIRCGPASTGAGSNGAFGLQVQMGTAAPAAIAAPNTVVTSQPDHGGGTYFLSKGAHGHKPGFHSKGLDSSCLLCHKLNCENRLRHQTKAAR